MREDFAVFIITHGRPDKQLTYNTLCKCGYTGKFYFVLDNTDNTIQEYIDAYGADNIVVFDKNHYINSDEFDNGTNTGMYVCAVYARRATEDIAKALGLTYFCMMDDDVLNLSIRFTIDGKLKSLPITNLDKVFDAYLNVLCCENVSCVGFGYITLYYDVSRFLNEDKRPLPFVAFIRNVNVKTEWRCWYGEDELSGYYSNTLGKLWVAIPWVMLTGTQVATGAMADTYLKSGSYLRSIAEFRYRPSDFIITQCLRGRKKGEYKLYKKNNSWFPKIISDKYRKEKRNAT